MGALSMAFQSVVHQLLTHTAIHLEAKGKFLAFISRYRLSTKAMVGQKLPNTACTGQVRAFRRTFG